LEGKEIKIFTTDIKKDGEIAFYLVGDMGQQFKRCTVQRCKRKIEQEELLYQSELRFKAQIVKARCY
jgi:hypothetical protein